MRPPSAFPPAVGLHDRPANAVFHSVASGHLGGSLTPLRLSPLLLRRYDRQRNRRLGRGFRLLLFFLLLLLQEVRAAQVWGRATTSCVCTVLHLRYADARMCRASFKQTSLPHALDSRDNADDASSLAVRGDAAAAEIFHPAKLSCRRCLMARAAVRRLSLFVALRVAVAAAAAIFLLIKDEEVNLRRLLPDAHVSHRSLWGF